jgi:HSP20 family protein
MFQTKTGGVMSLIKRSDWPLAGGSLLSDFFDDDRFFNSPWLKGQNMPAVNVKENDKSFEVELAAPGYNKGDFNISIEQGLLTISAEREEEKEDKDQKNGKYTKREFGYTSFTRSFTLPANVSEKDVKASFENGVLKLTINKTEMPDSKSKRNIQIQ